MKKLKILILIPALNEAKNLPQVIKEVKKYFLRTHLLIVNDGSQDETTIVAEKNGAEVLNLALNLGIGGAVQSGLIYAYENGYDLVLKMDADGQHRAIDLVKLANIIQKNNVDFLIGSRFLSDKKFKFGFGRKFGIQYFSWFIRLVTGKNISDPTSGLQAIKGKTIKFLAENYSQDYPEVEIILLLLRAGYKIKEVPVQMKQRQAGKSSISWRKSIYFVFKVTLALLVSLLRAKPERR